MMREWILADFRRAKKADLERYLSMAAEDGYVLKNAPTNNSARIAGIRGLRRLFWNNQQKARSESLTKQHELSRAAKRFNAAVRGAEPTGRITASEANAFLRSLPTHQQET